LKSLLAILFFITVLWQPFYQSGYIAYWQINKEKIAKTECINRFKPMMHCNGKCQLYNELKKAADEETENNKLPMAVLKLKTLDTYIESEIAWHWNVIFVDRPIAVFYNSTESVLNGFSISLFKPPQKLA
jgi:hypothetical protein